MWHKEKVKCTIYNFGLFNKSVVYIGTLWRISDSSISPMSTFLTTHLEESLSHSFVDNYQGYFGHLNFCDAIFLLFFFICKRVLLCYNLVELFQLMLDDLLSHRVANSISVNKDVVRQVPLIMVTESTERILEVLLQHWGRDDLLTFLALRTCLSVIFTHMLIIGSTEAYDRLFTFVTNINTDKHSLLGYFRTKVQSPEVTT